MYTGCSVEMHMIKMILAGEDWKDTIYKCEIFAYNETEEELHMVLLNDKLPAVSLDAEYECEIWTEEEKITCQGRVKERYIDKRGSNLIFQIENGFYKNSLN